MSDVALQPVEFGLVAGVLRLAEQVERPAEQEQVWGVRKVGLGLLMSGGQIMLTHGMADGKFGLSMDDLVYSYYGDREGSKLEAKLNGSMKEYAPGEAKLGMIKWARAGAPEGEWESKIKTLTDQH